MKKILLSALLLTSTFLTLEAQDQTHSLSGFSDLHASTSVQIELIASNQHKAEVDILQGDPDHFRIEENGDKLKIYWKNKMNFGKSTRREAKVKLYYTTLESIDVSAGAKVFGSDLLKADDFDVDVNSGGLLKVNIAVDELNADVNSGGRFEVSGKANRLDIDANSGGHFAGDKLEATDVKAHANSGGLAKVWATNSIRASANTGGNVSYKGDPKDTDIKKDKWTGGMVSKM